MKPVLGLFVMIDAMGWEILRNDSFGQDFAPTRKRLDSVFGYSATCVPSILSGHWPVEHRNWCYFGIIGNCRKLSLAYFNTQTSGGKS